MKTQMHVQKKCLTSSILLIPVLLFLMLPSGMFASDLAEDFINADAIQFDFYINILEDPNSAPVSQCFVDKGKNYLAFDIRRSLHGTDGRRISYEVAINDTTGIIRQMETSAGADPQLLTEQIFFFKGGELSKAKKHVTGDACDNVMGTPRSKIVFVTNLLFTGNLVSQAKTVAGVKGKIKSGVEAGNKICTKLANDAGLSGGTYTAWLSNIAGAEERLKTTDLPWLETTANARIADNLADLLNCGNPTCLQAAIVGDESRNLVDSRDLVWTGTGSDGGEDSGGTCLGWTDGSDFGPGGTLGQIGIGPRDGEWTDDRSRPCSTLAHLYCFED